MATAMNSFIETKIAQHEQRQQQYELDRQEVRDIGSATSWFGAKCLLFGGISAVVGYAGQQLDDFMAEAVSVHASGEAAVRDVAQFIAEAGASGAVIMGGVGVGSMAVAGAAHLLDSAIERSDRQVAADLAHQDMRANEQQELVRSVFDVSGIL